MLELTRYQWYKAHNICPCCCSNRPEPGKVYCEICNIKRKQQQKQTRNRPDYKQKKKVSEQKLREERKKNNRCVRCGGIKFKDDKKYCDVRLVKFREWRMKNGY